MAPCRGDRKRDREMERGRDMKREKEVDSSASSQTPRLFFLFPRLPDTGWNRIDGTAISAAADSEADII